MYLRFNNQFSEFDAFDDGRGNRTRKRPASGSDQPRRSGGEFPRSTGAARHPHRRRVHLRRTSPRRRRPRANWRISWSSCQGPRPGHWRPWMSQRPRPCGKAPPFSRRGLVRKASGVRRPGGLFTRVGWAWPTSSSAHFKSAKWMRRDRIHRRFGASVPRKFEQCLMEQRHNSAMRFRPPAACLPSPGPPIRQSSWRFSLGPRAYSQASRAAGSTAGLCFRQRA